MSRYPWRDTSEDIASEVPSQWETPAGAQAKADAALLQANTYTDNKHQDFIDHKNNQVVHVTQADHDKLNGIEAGANKYVHPATHPPSIIAQDSSNRFVSDAQIMTWNSKASTDLVTDTTKGLMSPELKVKVDGIATGAEVNQNAFSKVNNIDAGNKTDALTIKGSTGISVTTNPTTKEVTITATGDATPGPHAETHVTGGSDPIPVATDTTDGLMPSSAVQVINTVVAKQAEWDGKETPTGAQTKADAAEQNAKTYTDNNAAPKVHEHAASAITSGTLATARLPAASVSAAGIVQLNNTATSTSTTQAATAGAVKQVNDKFSNMIRINAGKLEYWNGSAWKGVGGMEYTKPRVALFESNMSPNTWYQIASINGSGRINRISVTTANPLGNNSISVRVTLDGVVTDYPTPSNGNSAYGFQHSESESGGKSMDLTPNVIFKSSCKLEVMQTTNTQPLMNALLDYALE